MYEILSTENNRHIRWSLDTVSTAEDNETQIFITETSSKFTLYNLFVNND